MEQATVPRESILLQWTGDGFKIISNRRVMQSPNNISNELCKPILSTFQRLFVECLDASDRSPLYIYTKHHFNLLGYNTSAVV